MSKPSANRALFPWIIAFISLAAAALIMAGPARRGQHGSSALLVANQGAAAQSPAAVTPAARARIQASYAALPLAFEANEGQTDPQVKYMARGNGYKLFLTSSHATLTIPTRRGVSEVADMIQNKRRGPAAVKALLRKRRAAQQKQATMASVQMDFLGASSGAQMVAEDKQAGRVNYFVGNDSAKWHSNIPLFGRVNYKNIYPGVNLAFHGASERLEFDYLVSPGADPGLIALGFQGARQVHTTADGDLILTTEAGSVRLHKPIAYQQKEGARQSVDARFVTTGKNRVEFALGAYDRSRELVIDPVVTYSTYFGGNFADYGLAIAVDAGGDAFVAGATDSASIPGFSTGTNNGSFDAFVSVIDPTGVLIFSTEFGGSADEFPGGIAIDNAGDIYVAGTTASIDFPVTVGAAQTTFQGGATNGANDAFAAKLAPTGAITWATYIGGNDSDSGLGIAVDSSLNVYVVGETFSPNLPVVNALPNGSSLNLGLAVGADDGYIVKINPAGSSFLMVSYIGGSSGDLATGVALNGSGTVLISGETISNDLKTTPINVVQPTCGTDANCNNGTSGAQDDAFVASIRTNPAVYNYLTYYGGSGADDALAIAAGSAGNAFITGGTASSDFPIHGSPFQSSLFGTQNAFVVELNATGTASTYSSFLGGSGSDIGVGVAVDGADNIYLTGQTSSSDFPALNPTQANLSGSTDAFISVLSQSQRAMLFSTFLGGGGDENLLGGSIALDPLQYIYVTGDTDSGNGSTGAFPTKNPVAGGGTYGGGTCLSSTGSNVPCPDAFIAEYSPATVPDFSISASALNPATVGQGGSATSTVNVTALNGYANTVNLTCAVTGGGSPAPKCSFNPTSTSGSGSSTLTVTTTGVNGALVHPSSIFYAMLLPVFGLSLMGIRFSYAGSGRKKLLGFLLLGLVMTALFFLPACGGSSSSGGGGGCSGCTPKGSYTVSVTGTDGTLTNPGPALTLTVN